MCGSLENAVVEAYNDKVLNKGGLRNDKERNHKILDLAGDFYYLVIE